MAPQLPAYGRHAIHRKIYLVLVLVAFVSAISRLVPSVGWESSSRPRLAPSMARCKTGTLRSLTFRRIGADMSGVEWSSLFWGNVKREDSIGYVAI